VERGKMERDQKATRVILPSALLSLTFLLAPNSNAQLTSTNCMVTGDMLNCTSIGGQSGNDQNDSGRILGEGIGSLISNIGEKNFRKKIGRMLAAGDCETASRYAYEKGRLELGSSIASQCRRPPSAAAPSPRQAPAPEISPLELEQALAHVAQTAKTPMEVFEKTTVSKVEARGKELLMTALVDQAGASLTESGRMRMRRAICEASAPLLKAGATIRVDFFEKSKSKSFDTLVTTRRDCFI
jgi:hypothetical protein